MYERAANQIKLAKACKSHSTSQPNVHSDVTCSIHTKLMSMHRYIDVWCSYAGGDAGQASEKLAQTHLKLESRLEAASSYVEAAKCYQKTNKSGDTGRILHRLMLLLMINDTSCSELQEEDFHCAMQMCYASYTTQSITTQSLAVLEWQPSSSG